mmetsp:Transcript_45060/g.114259  ORF Transcript_45060/g.114259 Transcript_45060/m.114259 type:complete len:443 (-) Transcript_45060:55-1383(-)
MHRHDHETPHLFGVPDLLQNVTLVDILQQHVVGRCTPWCEGLRACDDGQFSVAASSGVHHLPHSTLVPISVAVAAIPLPVAVCTGAFPIAAALPGARGRASGGGLLVGARLEKPRPALRRRVASDPTARHPSGPRCVGGVPGDALTKGDGHPDDAVPLNLLRARLLHPRADAQDRHLLAVQRKGLSDNDVALCGTTLVDDLPRGLAHHLEVLRPTHRRGVHRRPAAREDGHSLQARGRAANKDFAASGLLHVASWRYLAKLGAVQGELVTHDDIKVPLRAIPPPVAPPAACLHLGLPHVRDEPASSFGRFWKLPFLALAFALRQPAVLSAAACIPVGFGAGALDLVLGKDQQLKGGHLLRLLDWLHGLPQVQQAEDAILGVRRRPRLLVEVRLGGLLIDPVLATAFLLLILTTAALAALRKGGHIGRVTRGLLFLLLRAHGC